MTQSDFFHHSAFPRNFNEVALGDLVLDQKEQPCKEILDQALSAESDGNARYARRCKDRRDRDADLVKRQHTGNREHDDGRGVLKDVA